MKLTRTYILFMIYMKLYLFMINLSYYMLNLNICVGYNYFLNNILIDRFEFITNIVELGLRLK